MFLAFFLFLFYSHQVPVILLEAMHSIHPWTQNDQDYEPQWCFQGTPTDMETFPWHKFRQGKQLPQDTVAATAALHNSRGLIPEIIAKTGFSKPTPFCRR